MLNKTESDRTFCCEVKCSFRISDICHRNFDNLYLRCHTHSIKHINTDIACERDICIHPEERTALVITVISTHVAYRGCEFRFHSFGNVVGFSHIFRDVIFLCNHNRIYILSPNFIKRVVCDAVLIVILLCTANNIAKLYIIRYSLCLCEVTVYRSLYVNALESIRGVYLLGSHDLHTACCGYR